MDTDTVTKLKGIDLSLSDLERYAEDLSYGDFSDPEVCSEYQSVHDELERLEAEREEILSEFSDAGLLEELCENTHAF